MAGAGYDKADFWAIKAKKEGYPARSVFKLMELDKKFRLIKPGMKILDIGAAPGSWSLFVLKQLNGKGFLSAVDLSPMGIKPPYSNYFFLKGDLYSPEVRKAVAEHGPYDLVLSDAAPATTGSHSLDTDRSEAIVEAVLDYADEMLRAGGNVVCKLFVGGGERDILDRIKENYETARGFKPIACRQVSFETYVVGMHRKKPPVPAALP